MSDKYLAGAVDAIHLALEIVEKTGNRREAERLIEQALEYARRGFSLSEVRKLLGLRGGKAWKATVNGS